MYSVQDIEAQVVVFVWIDHSTVIKIPAVHSFFNYQLQIAAVTNSLRRSLEAGNYPLFERLGIQDLAFCTIG
jgi:hypothetical protein